MRGGLCTALLLARQEETPLIGGRFHAETAVGLDLSEVELHQAEFRSCRFTDCNFSSTAFYGCRFADCLFDRCRFVRSYWQDTVLTGSKADGGDFRKARLKSCTLEGTLLRYANFTASIWDRTALTGCSLREAVLADSRVSRTLFHDADLTGASFFHTPLAVWTSPAVRWTVWCSPRPAESSGELSFPPPRPPWWPGFWAFGWFKVLKAPDLAIRSGNSPEFPDFSCHFFRNMIEFFQSPLAAVFMRADTLSNSIQRI